MIAPHEKPPDGELDEAAKGMNQNVNQDPPGGRADHRQHQVLNNPLRRLWETHAHIRSGHPAVLALYVFEITP